MIKEKLLNLCMIKSGYSFRTSIENNPNGDIFIIQPKNILSNEQYMPKVSSNDIKSVHILKPKDILITNRGKFLSDVFNSSFKMVATSGFFILKVKSNKVTSEYISIYLNSMLGQKQLELKKEIKAIPALTLKALGEVEIPIATIKKQKILSEIYLLHKKETALLQKIQNLKQQQLKAIIKGVLND